MGERRTRGAALLPRHPTARPGRTRSGRCSRRCTAPARSAVQAMTGHAVNQMIQRRAGAGRFHPGADRPAGWAFAAGWVRHRGVPGRRGRARDHAADRAPVTGDARGVRPGERPVDGQRSHPHRSLTHDDRSGARHSCRPYDPGVRRDLGVVHRLVRRHRSPGAARGTRPRWPRSWSSALLRRRLGGGGSRRSITIIPRPGMRRPGQSPAVFAALGRAARESGASDLERGGRGCGAAGVAQSRVDPRNVRAAGPLPAGAVPTGGGAVQAPGER